MLTDRWAHLYMHTSHIHRHTDVQRVFFLNFKHNLLFWKNLWRSVWYDFLILDTWLSQDDYFPVACFCVVLRQLSLCREICLSSECWTQTREPLGPVQLQRFVCQFCVWDRVSLMWHCRQSRRAWTVLSSTVRSQMMESQPCTATFSSVQCGHQTQGCVPARHALAQAELRAVALLKVCYSPCLGS